MTCKCMDPCTEGPEQCISDLASITVCCQGPSTGSADKEE